MCSTRLVSKSLFSVSALLRCSVARCFGCCLGVCECSCSIPLQSSLVEPSIDGHTAIWEWECFSFIFSFSVAFALA